MTSEIVFLSTSEPPWIDMEPVRVGQVPSGLGTADRYVAVRSDDGTLLRVDLYRSDHESFAFEDACIWSNLVVIGWGHQIYLINPRTRSVSPLNLGGYFGHLYANSSWLLVASAERLFCVEPDGSLRWRSDVLGIDGVVVHDILDDAIRGSGEWDPPGGWQAFRISLKNGLAV